MFYLETNILSHMMLCFAINQSAAHPDPLLSIIQFELSDPFFTDRHISAALGGMQIALVFPQSSEIPLHLKELRNEIPEAIRIRKNEEKDRSFSESQTSV